MALLALWFWWGEPFLCATNRVAADTLVVEGWIGRVEAMRVAKNEFEQGGYQCLVVTGGLAGEPWWERRRNVAEDAKSDLLELGFPPGKLIVASYGDSESQRTYVSALAAKHALEAKGQHPKGINVLSRAVHARRSRLVYAKVFRPTVKVGTISWWPYAQQTRSWWRSSSRAKELLNESFGFAYEALLSSGRWFTGAPALNPPPPANTADRLRQPPATRAKGLPKSCAGGSVVHHTRDES